MQSDFASASDDVIPATRLERVAMTLGHVLLFGGFAVLFLAPNHSDSAVVFTAATMSTLAGAGVTACCFILNAVRRW